jgi:hypothetical protein
VTEMALPLTTQRCANRADVVQKAQSPSNTRTGRGSGVFTR